MIEIVIGLGFVTFSSPGTQSVHMRLETIHAQATSVEFLGLGPDGRWQIRREVDGELTAISMEDILQLTPRLQGEVAAPAPPAKHLVFILNDGGRIRGKLIARPTASPRLLHVDLGGDRLVDISFSALAAVRTASEEPAAVREEFEKRLAARVPGRDLLIVAKDGKPLVVPGSLERLGPEGWDFRFGSRIRSARLEAAYGFVLGAPPTAVEERPATVIMADGNRFTASISSADSQAVSFETGSLGRMTVPWGWIREISLRSPRLVYVSDLEPGSSRTESILGVEWPVQRDRNVTGGPIRLGGMPYARGLGTHARTVLTYDLGGAYEQFHAVVGVDDSVAPKGNVVFRVWGDDRVLYESGSLRGGQAPERISLDVKGVRVLVLETDFGADLDMSDHADWADAILIRAEDGGDL